MKLNCFVLNISAKWVLGDADLTGGRRTRSSNKKEVPKSPMKRAGTMQKTAKEGKAYLKRSAKDEEEEDEEEREEEEQDEEA